MLGFLLAATPRGCWLDRGALLFQSRAGFSPRRDLTSSGMVYGGPSFQSRAGFSPRRDRHTQRQQKRQSKVSIPCWVFSSPRLVVKGLIPRSLMSFNPVLGFLLAATPGDNRSIGSKTLFQSRAGFSPRRDTSRSYGDPHSAQFQSRAGFSPRRDRISDRCRRAAGAVSIPCWVFSSPRPHLSL